MRVEAADELQPALEESFARTDQPTVVVVPIDYSENLKLTKRLGALVAEQ